MKRPLNSAVLTLCLLLMTATKSWGGTPPQVVTSIKPIQLIALAVTEGITSVDTLLPAGASPHGHSFSPSDVKKLNRADVLFWVGPDLETFLEKPAALAEKVVSVPLMEKSVLTLLENHTGDEHTHHHDHDHHHHHNGRYDTHIWLDPDNAVAMAETMVKELVRLDPDHKEAYQKNLLAFRKDVEWTDRTNIEKLQNYHSRPMFVFHDAYRYLQAHYRLNVIDYFTVTPEQKPGLKHLNEIEQKLNGKKESCIFSEPEAKSSTLKYIAQLTENTDAKTASIDPLAIGITPSPSGYVDFLSGMVDTIVGCFN